MATYFMDGQSVWDDYNTWTYDNTLLQEANTAAKDRYTASTDIQIAEAGDTSTFDAQASSLGYDAESDYYTRGLAGIQSKVDELVVQQQEGQAAYDSITSLYDQDLKDLQAGPAYEILMNLPIGSDVKFGTRDGYIDPYNQMLRTVSGYGITEADIAESYGVEQSETWKAYYGAAFGGTNIDPTVGDRLASEDEARIIADEQRAAIEAANIAGGEATKFAGRATQGGGSQFEQTVPIELDKEEDEEETSWWS